ncbi:MAG TPA: hypothetical protein VGD74_05565 [Vulgatibacter sp.]
MSPLRLTLLLALTSCADAGPRPWACWYEEPPSTEAICRLCAALPAMPASPWDCVTSITIGDEWACPETAGCHLPDQRSIYTTQAALHHELAHAASECATGDPDYGHAAAFWRGVK